MELVPYNPYFIGERALPNRLRVRLIASASRSALLTESHCSRSVIVILTVAGPREGRWWMITIPDLAEIRGLRRFLINLSDV
jgi:hypothetical protein